MSSVEFSQDEISALSIKYAKRQLNNAEKWANSIFIVSHSIEKIIRRVEARILIKEMEKGTDKYAVRSILSGLASLINNNLSSFDYFDQNAVFDLDTNDKDFITVQNDSIWLSDWEDIEINNANLKNSENKSFHQGMHNQN